MTSSELSLADNRFNFLTTKLNFFLMLFAFSDAVVISKSFLINDLIKANYLTHSILLLAHF